MGEGGGRPRGTDTHFIRASLLGALIFSTSGTYSFLRFWKRSQLTIGNVWTFQEGECQCVNQPGHTDSRSHGHARGTRGWLSLQAEAKCPWRAGAEQTVARRPRRPGCALATGKPMRWRADKG